MASTFELEIVTPDRIFFKGPVERMVVRTVNGDVGILKEHMSFVSPLSIGEIKIRTEGKRKEATCAGGFIQTRQDKTTIITDSAEWPEEIDVKRAKEAKERAEKRLASAEKNIDVARAHAALQRALNRLSVVNRE